MIMNKKVSNQLRLRREQILEGDIVYHKLTGKKMIVSAIDCRGHYLGDFEWEKHYLCRLDDMTVKPFTKDELRKNQI